MSLTEVVQTSTVGYRKVKVSTASFVLSRKPGEGCPSGWGVRGYLLNYVIVTRPLDHNTLILASDISYIGLISVIFQAKIIENVLNLLR